MSRENTDFRIKACEQDLIRKTTEALPEKYAGRRSDYKNNKQRGTMEQVMQRYAVELETVLHKGYAPEFYLAQIIQTYVMFDLEEPVCQTGENAYSLLSYLYGLTDNIDPINHDYSAEMLFGDKYAKRPLFSFIVRLGVRADIVSWLKYLFSEDCVSEPDENTICVIWPSEERAVGNANHDNAAEKHVVEIMIMERQILTFAESLNIARTPEHFYPLLCDQQILDACDHGFGIRTFDLSQTLPASRLDHVRAVLSDLMDVMASDPYEGIDADLMADIAGRKRTGFSEQG